MSTRAKMLQERQAANVVANQKLRQQQLGQKRTDDAPVLLDQSSRTLSKGLSTKERAMMLQAKRSASASASTRGSIAVSENRMVVCGMRSSSGGSNSSTDGHTSAPRKVLQQDRQERGAAARQTPLASLLESVGLQGKRSIFDQHGITYEVLAGATDAVLSELLSHTNLGLKIGEIAALRSELQKVNGTDRARNGETGGGGMREDVSRFPHRSCCQYDACMFRSPALTDQAAGPRVADPSYVLDGGGLLGDRVRRARWLFIKRCFRLGVQSTVAGAELRCASADVLARRRGTAARMAKCVACVFPQLKIFNYAGGDEEVEAAFKNEVSQTDEQLHKFTCEFTCLRDCYCKPVVQQLCCPPDVLRSWTSCAN